MTINHTFLLPIDYILHLIENHEIAIINYLPFLSWMYLYYLPSLQVVYVTATAPYVFLTIIFIKGLTLDGAVDGITTYLTPDFSKLLTVQVRN